MGSSDLGMVVMGLALARPANADNDSAVQNRVSRAVAAYPADPAQARRELQDIGGAAVPYLVRTLWCGDDTASPRRRFLLGVIAGIDGPGAQLGLVRLLFHWDPNVRGESAAILGKRRARDALPVLLSALDDEAVYLTRVSTDPHTEEAILVRDKVVEALEEITGTVLARGQSSRDKVSAWKAWRDERLR